MSLGSRIAGPGIGSEGPLKVGTRFVELSDAGHTAAGDDNDAFSAAVVEFVSS